KKKKKKKKNCLHFCILINAPLLQFASRPGALNRGNTVFDDNFGIIFYNSQVQMVLENLDIVSVRHSDAPRCRGDCQALYFSFCDIKNQNPMTKCWRGGQTSVNNEKMLEGRADKCE
ncbi:MAG: hypothetical protein ABW185_23130, partial [Sedimenticola sp.]